MLDHYNTLALSIRSTPSFFTRHLFFGTRKEKGVTLSKLAEKSKVSKRTISYLESGEFIPRIETCAKIAKALGIPGVELKKALLQDFENHVNKALE